MWQLKHKKRLIYMCEADCYERSAPLHIRKEEYMTNGVIKRGEIYYANLSPARGSEQDGIRPVLIIQNNKGNRYSPCVIAAITSIEQPNHPTHVEIGTECGLNKTSYVMLDQIRTIDKSRLIDYIGQVDDQTIKEVNEALSISFGLIDEYNRDFV
jgi:mRNA interferase MazF